MHWKPHWSCDINTVFTFLLQSQKRIHTYQYLIQTISTMLLKLVVTFSWKIVATHCICSNLTMWQDRAADKKQICSCYIVKISLLTCTHVWNLLWHPFRLDSGLIKHKMLQSVINWLFKSYLMWLHKYWLPHRELQKQTAWLNAPNIYFNCYSYLSY